MAYKGTLPVGGSIRITLAVDGAGKGPGILFATASKSTGASISGKRVVAPNGTDSLTLTPKGDGVLKIHVDVTGAQDKSMLQTFVNGALRDTGNLTGDEWWTYDVQ